MGDTYNFWKRVKDEGRYDEEKRKLAEQISSAFCRKYTQAKGKIEVIDIATPLTYERYTGAYHGSWMTVQGPGDRMQNYPGFVKDVKGLYFSGHRITPSGGLPSALTVGRLAAQMVCRQFNTVFL
jgi:phytoene dehydrogenase-like protein